MTLLVGGAVVGSMVTLPSSAHTGPVKSIPAAGDVVRAVDPTQTAPNPAGGNFTCPEFNWGGTASKLQNPCVIFMIFNQPIDTTGSDLKVFGPNGNTAVAGTISYRDSQTAPVTAAGSVLSNIPGPDTVVLTPAAALAPGKYAAVATSKDLAELGGHGSDCDPDGGTQNCFEWSFTVAPVAATPVITSPADAGTVATRLVDVEGTAEPNSLIEILAGTDVLGEGQANPDGVFSVLIPAAAGSNTITARATSRLTTTAERVWAAYAACADAALAEETLELECGEAPAEAVPPVVTSAASTFTATVVDDVEAPSLQMETAPDTIQVLETPLIVGHARDNDQIEDVVVVVTDILGATVTDYTVTFDKAAITEWEIHFHGILNRYTVSVHVVDSAGNESETITTSYIVTTGDLLE